MEKRLLPFEKKEKRKDPSQELLVDTSLQHKI